jgi:hypothetical protein
MMRIAWKPYIGLGFILFLIFSGCGERQPPVDELVVQAEELLDAGQIENAILILEKCQDRAPERVDVLEALAFAYAAKGDPMLASMTFLRIRSLVPSGRNTASTQRKPFSRLMISKGLWRNMRPIWKPDLKTARSGWGWRTCIFPKAA